MNGVQTVLSRLMEVIEDRRANRPANSYTTQLLDRGIETIAAKLREETEELLAAAQSPTAARQEIVHETADLIYHLLVLLAYRQVTLAEVEAELARRFGTSGLDEKARRAEHQDGP